MLEAIADLLLLTNDADFQGSWQVVPAESRPGRLGEKAAVDEDGVGLEASVAGLVVMAGWGVCLVVILPDMEGEGGLGANEASLMVVAGRGVGVVVAARGEKEEEEGGGTKVSEVGRAVVAGRDVGVVAAEADKKEEEEGDGTGASEACRVVVAGRDVDVVVAAANEEEEEEGATEASEGGRTVVAGRDVGVVVAVAGTFWRISQRSWSEEKRESNPTVHEEESLLTAPLEPSSCQLQTAHVYVSIAVQQSVTDSACICINSRPAVSYRQRMYMYQ